MQMREKRDVKTWIDSDGDFMPRVIRHEIILNLSFYEVEDIRQFLKDKNKPATLMTLADLLDTIRE